MRPVAPHDRDSVCGPAKLSVAAESLGTIRGRTRYVRQKRELDTFTGARITVDGGMLNGLEVGQNLVVRRYFRVGRLAGTDSTGEHSAGLVQIVAVRERSSIAVVIYACDELRTGDFCVVQARADSAPAAGFPTTAPRREFSLPMMVRYWPRRVD